MKTSGPPQNTVIRPIAHHSFDPPRVPSGMSQAVTNAASQRQALGPDKIWEYPIMANITLTLLTTNMEPESEALEEEKIGRAHV